MKDFEWKTYRTRFLVKAKQLNSALSFIDSLGRQHCGRKGDYLVETSEGVLSITPRHVFEDIYVPMRFLQEAHCSAGNDEATLDEEQVSYRRVNRPASAMEEDGVRAPLSRLPAAPTREARSDEVGRRKLPQPYRDRRPSPSRLGLM